MGAKEGAHLEPISFLQDHASKTQQFPCSNDLELVCWVYKGFFPRSILLRTTVPLGKLVIRHQFVGGMVEVGCVAYGIYICVHVGLS